MRPKRTKSCGNRVCPKCGKNGKLKARISRNKRDGKERVYYECSHAYPQSARYPYFGKYKSTCYIGKLKQTSLDGILRTKTGNWW